MKNIVASSQSELISILSEIDINVPLRTKGRTTDHCENFSICLLLATLAESKSLSFPLRLEHKDKPDFRLFYGKNSIGIEVTEAIPEELASAEALAEKEFPEKFLDLGYYKWDKKIEPLMNKERFYHKMK